MGTQASLNHGRYGPFAQVVTLHGVEHTFAVGGTLLETRIVENRLLKYGIVFLIGDYSTNFLH
eukprot:m.217595 g.217595  ORF g.217595 m.217595 type:complete len:63 (+) comp15888_c0_seq5:596-784(+)